MHYFLWLEVWQSTWWDAAWYSWLRHVSDDDGRLHGYIGFDCKGSAMDKCDFCSTQYNRSIVYCSVVTFETWCHESSIDEQIVDIAMNTSLVKREGSWSFSRQHGLGILLDWSCDFIKGWMAQTCRCLDMAWGRHSPRLIIWLDQGWMAQTCTWGQTLILDWSCDVIKGSQIDLWLDQGISYDVMRVALDAGRHSPWDREWLFLRQEECGYPCRATQLGSPDMIQLPSS